MVYYVFAALGGHQFSQMAMVRKSRLSALMPMTTPAYNRIQGYRTHMGVGVVQSCEGALTYYQKSAEAGMIVIYLHI